MTVAVLIIYLKPCTELLLSTLMDCGLPYLIVPNRLALF